MSLIRKLLRFSALRQSVALSAVFLVVLIIAAGLTLSQARRAFDSRIDADLKQRFDLIAESYDLTAPENAYLLTDKLRYDSSDFVGFIAGDGKKFGFIPGKQALIPGFQTTELAETGGGAKFDWRRIVRKYRDQESGDRDWRRHWKEEWKKWREESRFSRREARDKHFENVWRIYSGPLNGGTLVVGTRLELREKLLEVLPRIFFISGFLIIVVVLLGGVVFGLLAQRRLRRISATLEQISDGDLTARIAPKRSRDDLDDLAANIDRTTAQLQVLMQQTRELSTSIAHDLKTPITRLKARLEEAEAALASGEGGAKALASATAQADYLIHIFDSLLQIARMEGGARRDRFTEVDLGRLAAEVGETFEAVVEDAGLKLSVEVEMPGTVRGDPVLLTQGLANLIENALRHAGEGGEIRLWVRGRTVGVSDFGSGIPEHLREEALEPLKQIDPSRSSGGAGLGLSIVNSITRLHDADLNLRTTDPAAGRGLTVEIRFS